MTDQRDDDGVNNRNRNHLANAELADSGILLCKVGDGKAARPHVDDAVEAIADKALERKTGARGLRAIMEAVMLDLMYRIPSDETISKCVIDKALVEKNLALDGSEVPAIEKKDEEKDEELAS